MPKKKTEERAAMIAKIFFLLAIVFLWFTPGMQKIFASLAKWIFENYTKPEAWTMYFGLAALIVWQWQRVWALLWRHWRGVILMLLIVIMLASIHFGPKSFQGLSWKNCWTNWPWLLALLCGVIYICAPKYCWKLNLDGKKSSGPVAPIAKSDDDKLGRAWFVDGLANIIENKKHHRMVITGDWGSGKTSVMNLVKEKIRERKNWIIVDFSPWLYANSSELWEGFGQAIAQALDKADGITPWPGWLTGNALFKVLKPLCGWRNLPDIGELVLAVTQGRADKETIENQLKQRLGPKEILVCIDDLDRQSDSDLVLEVLRNLKELLDCEGIVFLVALDWSQTKKILADKKYSDTEEYLEKIFQLHYPLPEMHSEYVTHLVLRTKKEYPALEQHLQAIIQKWEPVAEILQHPNPRKIKKILYEMEGVAALLEKRWSPSPQDWVLLGICQIMRREFPELIEKTLQNEKDILFKALQTTASAVKAEERAKEKEEAEKKLPTSTLGPQWRKEVGDKGKKKHIQEIFARAEQAAEAVINVTTRDHVDIIEDVSQEKNENRDWRQEEIAKYLQILSSPEILTDKEFADLKEKTDKQILAWLQNMNEPPIRRRSFLEKLWVNLRRQASSAQNEKMENAKRSKETALSAEIGRAIAITAPACDISMLMDLPLIQKLLMNLAAISANANTNDQDSLKNLAITIAEKTSAHALGMLEMKKDNNDYKLNGCNFSQGDQPSYSLLKEVYTIYQKSAVGSIQEGFTSTGYMQGVGSKPDSPAFYLLFNQKGFLWHDYGQTMDELIIRGQSDRVVFANWRYWLGVILAVQTNNSRVDINSFISDETGKDRLIKIFELIVNQKNELTKKFKDWLKKRIRELNLQFLVIPADWDQKREAE